MGNQISCSDGCASGQHEYISANDELNLSPKRDSSLFILASSLDSHQFPKLPVFGEPNDNARYFSKSSSAPFNFRSEFSNFSYRSLPGSSRKNNFESTHSTIDTPNFKKHNSFVSKNSNNVFLSTEDNTPYIGSINDLQTFDQQSPLHPEHRLSSVGNAVQLSKSMSVPYKLHTFGNGQILSDEENYGSPLYINNYGNRKLIKKSMSVPDRLLTYELVNDQILSDEENYGAPLYTSGSYGNRKLPNSFNLNKPRSDEPFPAPLTSVNDSAPTLKWIQNELLRPVGTPTKRSHPVKPLKRSSTLPISTHHRIDSQRYEDRSESPQRIKPARHSLCSSRSLTSATVGERLYDLKIEDQSLTAADELSPLSSLQSNFVRSRAVHFGNVSIECFKVINASLQDSALTLGLSDHSPQSNSQGNVNMSHDSALTLGSLINSLHSLQAPSPQSVLTPTKQYAKEAHPKRAKPRFGTLTDRPNAVAIR